MVKKIILPGLIILIAFFGLFYGLSQIDWVTEFNVKQIRSSSENKIGELIWDEISSTEQVNTNDSIRKTLDKLLEPICKNNNIERDSLKIHIVEKDEINAFALPNNHLVVYTGLITECKNQEALQGVLGHEIAHADMRHSTRSMTKMYGVQILLDVLAGDRAAIKQVTGALIGLKNSRKHETEADEKSVMYLC